MRERNQSAGNFEAVALRELEVLYRVAKRMTRNDSDAEDIVGQTLLAAAKSWNEFDGLYPRSWLLRILKNEWLQVLRKRKSRGETGLDEAVEPSDEGFWRKVEVQLTVDTILAALDKIPEEYRLAVTLCDVEEMSYDEAAIALEVPIGTVRSRLFRGRKLLQSRLVSLGSSV